MKLHNFSIPYFDDFIFERYFNFGIGKSQLGKYIKALKNILEYEYIIPDDLNSYTSSNFRLLLGNLLVDKNRSDKTYNGYRKFYKTFCNFLVRNELLNKNPFENIPKRKEPIRLPRSLTDYQVKELFNFINSFKNDDFLNIRNYSIVYTFLYCGIRRGELINIKVSDVNFNEGYIRIRHGKGDKERLVPLVGILANILKKYNNFTNIFHKREYFFCSCHGNGLSRNDLDYILNQILKGLSYRFTWHQLRHTFATNLVRENFDIYNISQILGHSRIDTTKIYLSCDSLKLKKQLEKVALYK